jgi:hypothetical protein
MKISAAGAPRKAFMAELVLWSQTRVALLKKSKQENILRGKSQAEANRVSMAIVPATLPQIVTLPFRR